MSLQTWLGLLRHLASHSASAKAAVAQTELLPAMQRSWTALSCSPAIMHDALLLVSTLVSDSFDGRHLVATTGQPPLLVILVRAFLRCVPSLLLTMIEIATGLVCLARSAGSA